MLSPLNVSFIITSLYELAPVSIDREINDWQPSAVAFRRENREPFEKMMSELDLDVLQSASLSKNPFEVILMGLMLQQQKMIRALMEQIRARK